MTEYLNINETAAILKITSNSVYKLLNHADPLKKLIPVNPTTYRGDGGYRFKSVDVEHLKQFYIKDDLTPSEAAKIIGRSTSFVHKLISDGKLNFTSGNLKGKKVSLIKHKDIEVYQNLSSRDIIYDKKTGIFLYQIWKKGEENGRIIDLKRTGHKKIEVSLLTERNEILSISEITKQGWQPAKQIEYKKTISTYGYAKFIFPKPTILDSMIYTVIVEFLSQLGPNNIRILRSEDKIIVELKKSVLKGIFTSSHSDMIDKMKQFIVEGSVTHKYDGTLIDTGLSHVIFYYPEIKKAILNRKAKEAGLTLQEWIEIKLNDVIQE